MSQSGASIEAILRLNTQPFITSLNETKSAVNNFKNALGRWGTDAKKVETGILEIQRALNVLIPYLNRFKNLVDQTKTFKSFANGLRTMSEAVMNFSNVTKTSQVGMIRIKEIITQWSNAVRNLQVSVKGEIATEQQEIGTLNQLRSSYQSTYMAKEKLIVPTRQYAQALQIALPPTRQLITGNRELINSENQLSGSTQKASNSIRSSASAMNQGTASANRMTSATSRLGKAMSSLRMMGSMVGSMLAYNFAHKLLVATGETIHAKSEMEGYFKMLNFGQGDIDHFNKALDDTVHQFQRVNKYALGETISSIGVEFNLTTQEMEKAMKVTSMITSEYLRAGRNANEASLAVKDVLQGQFQRLSRETGVKGEQLKDAGWNGDTTDVMSLLTALEKVAHDRNWDVFAEKANSLNDILTITQNRFGEWSADLVYSVQPAIVGAFNGIMDVAGMLAQSLSGIWTWLNSGDWTATATQIAGIGIAIGVVSQAMVMYRSQLSFVQAAQLGLKGSITSLIFGLKGQQMAEIGVRNSIMAKILGVKAETLAEGGLAKAIQERTAMTQLEAVEERLNSLSSKENSIAKMENAIQTRINKAELEQLITTEEADTLRKELNTAMTEANALSSLKQAGVNGTLTTTFIMLAGAENATAVATGEISVAMGVLNGIIAVSPIGWLTAGILALAGAFYVLTGGLDAHWSKMQQFDDTLQNSDSIVQANNEHLKQLADTLGTDSEEYKTAWESVDTFNRSLTKSKKLVKEYNDELSTLPVKLSEITSANSKGLGISEDGMKELSEYASGLQEGTNTYYRALQVLHKQQDDFSKSDRTMTYNMQERGAEQKDILNKREQHMEHYNNFMKHSAEHNTSKDWWGGTWNGILAGIDAFQIGLDYKTEDLAQWWHDAMSWYEGLPQELSNTIANIDWGILGDIGGNFTKWIDDAKKSLEDSWKTLTEMFKPVTDFLSDPLGNLGIELTNFDLFGKLLDYIFPKPVSAEDGEGHLPVADEMYQVIVQPIVDWFNGFMADPMSYIGNALQFTGIGSLISALFGGDAMDFSWAWEWLNNNVITPLQTQFNMFLSDPLSYIGGLVSGTGIGALINALIPNDGGISIIEYVQTSIITPFTTAIQTGIASIPILGDIAQMLGLVPQQNPNAQDKGSQLMRAFGNAVENTIAQIPILSDILRMLGIIPQANPTGRSNGQGVGKSIVDGVMNGLSNLASQIIQEFNDALAGIGELGQKAFQTAQNWANQLWEGVNSILQRASPGFFHDQFKAEFGTDIPNAINTASTQAYTVGQNYATMLRDGVSSVSSEVGLTGMVDNYETDAQIVAESSQMMGMTTATAFNDMSMQVSSSTGQMQTNVSSTYNTIATNQNTMLNNMKTKNTTAYNEMYQRSNQSLIQMRDSTSNLTHQMTNAWNLMKNNIVASAQQLQHDSTVHFNNLSNTIGSFYRKIQNPSNWGGSPHGGSTHRNVSAGRRIVSAFTGGKKYAGGRNNGIYHGSNTMTVASLKKKICPNGDCNGIFNGFSATDRVDVRQFLSMLDEGGFGGWGDWHPTHYNYIKKESDEWSMKSPTIQLQGGIPTNANYKVGDFENGSPKISFSSFQSMAESIFSAIPYRFYYNSDWKGSWLGALQAGACNCWDGAHAILAFANSCGFGGGIEHGTWVDPDGTTYPHVYAVINGKKMDTTGWQNRRSWSAGSPNVRTANSPRQIPTNNNKEKTLNINITFNEAVYGVEDLDTRIRQGVKEGIREEFNDPYTVAI